VPGSERIIVSPGEFTDVAANELDTFVAMKLYKGQLIGTACASREIEEIHWLNL
jgi:hypothetical protein